MSNRKHLTPPDRIDIESALRQGLSLLLIAKRLGKHPSTIAREIRSARFEKAP